MLDDDINPKLRRIGSRGSKGERRFLHQVLSSASLARGGAAKSGFTDSRIGCGAGAGRMLSSRDRYTAFLQRRVIVKSRIVKLAGTGRNRRRDIPPSG